MKAKYLAAALGAILFCSPSCVNDLETLPLNEWDKTAETAYGADLEGYLQGLAKLYRTIGTHSLSFIDGVDGGATETIRAFWACQEFTTDAAKCAWGNDAWVRAMNTNTWSDAENEAVYGVFFRSLQSVSYVNEYLRQTAPDKLSNRGVTADVAASVEQFRAEARFIRAFYYWMAMDVFGDVPFTTENSEFGAEPPKQLPRTEVYNYIVNELEALAADGSAMPAARSNYPRADKGAVLGLLSRIYLNAEVYTGTPQWVACQSTCERLFKLGYDLCPNYADLFRGDNGQNPDALKELIFAVDYDNDHAQSYGGTSFLTLAAINSTDITDTTHPNGVNGGWGGLRTTYEFATTYFGVKNPNYETGEYDVVDERGKFFAIKGKTESIENNLYEFTCGWGCLKFNNIPHDMTEAEFNETAKTKAYSDIDFPVIRLAEIYLTYAEACMHLNQSPKGLPYLKLLAERAGVAAPNDYDQDYLLAERARELMWESHRRTDLIRFGKFTSGTFLWPYKGGDSFVGQSFPEYKQLFAIPASHLRAKLNLYNPEGY